MQKRTKKFLEVSFYLSKFGKIREGEEYPKPPERLKSEKWNEAYRIFYEKLNGGRSILTFERSLKNARDAFDSHLLNSGREGWKATDRSPNPLGIDAQKVYNELADKTESQIWSLLNDYADLNASDYHQQFSELINIQESESDNKITFTEGGKKYVILSTYERSPSLRKKAIDIHGTICQICKFDFEKYYGDIGSGFIEVHHIRSLADNEGNVIETNPKTDLAVICANCHRMIHRKKGKPISIEELQRKVFETKIKTKM